MCPIGHGSEIAEPGSVSLRTCRKIDTIPQRLGTFLANRLTGAVSPRSAYRQRDLKLRRRELLETEVDAVVWAQLAATLLDCRGSLGCTSGTANHCPIFSAPSATGRQLGRQGWIRVGMITACPLQRLGRLQRGMLVSSCQSVLGRLQSAENCKRGSQNVRYPR